MITPSPRCTLSFVSRWTRGEGELGRGDREGEPFPCPSPRVPPIRASYEKRLLRARSNRPPRRATFSSVSSTRKAGILISFRRLFLSRIAHDFRQRVARAFHTEWADNCHQVRPSFQLGPTWWTETTSIKHGCAIFFFTSSLLPIKDGESVTSEGKQKDPMWTSCV